MKIGVYGGSFNPCHLMHKELVLRLLNEGYVDKIVIVPAGDYYFKSNLLKGIERFKMLQIMFEGDDRIEICDYEFKNNLIRTYRTLDYLQGIYKNDKLYFITGGDNLLNLHTWKRIDYILNNYNFIIINREGIDISKEISKYEAYSGEFICLNLKLLGISSSKVRELISNLEYEEAKKILDPKVLDYIIEKRFYHQDYKEEINSDEYISDEEFLKNYNSDNYEKMSITTDITLFGVSDISKDNYRHVDKKAFSVLLVKRNTPPFMNKWCLPGGFLSLDETLIDCAKRVLFVETNLEDVYLEQLYTFSDIERDIRARVLSCSYLGLVDKNLISRPLRDNAKFFIVSVKEDNDIVTIDFKSDDEAFSCKVLKKSNRYGIESYQELENNYLAFDNLLVIATSINRLRNKIDYTDIVFHMMPKEFTLKELQLVYEAILDKKLLDPAFRRVIKDKVEKTGEVRVDGGHRPSALYRYKGE